MTNNLISIKKLLTQKIKQKKTEIASAQTDSRDYFDSEDDYSDTSVDEGILMALESLNNHLFPVKITGSGKDWLQLANLKDRTKHYWIADRNKYECDLCLFKGGRWWRVYSGGLTKFRNPWYYYTKATSGKPDLLKKSPFVAWEEL